MNPAVCPFILYTCLVPPWRDFTETEQSQTSKRVTSPSRTSKMPWAKIRSNNSKTYPGCRTTKDIFHPNMARNSFPETRRTKISRRLSGRFAAGNSIFEDRGAGTFCSGTVGGNDSFAAWLLISKPHKYTIKIGNGKLILSILCVCMLPLLSQGMGSGRTLDCPDLSSMTELAVC